MSEEASKSLLSRILKGTANYGAGSFLPQLIGFFLIPVYTRFLSPEDYGIADMVSAVGAVMVIFFRFGLTGAVTRFYFDQEKKEDLSAYVTTVGGFILIWSFGVGGAMSIWSEPLFDVMAPGIRFSPYILLGIWTAVFGVIPEIQRRLLQAEEKSRFHMFLTLGKFGTNLILAIILVVIFDLRVYGVLLAAFLAEFVFFLVAIDYLRRFLVAEFRWDMLKDSLSYGVPMLPHHLSSWVMNLGSRVFLNYYGTTAAVGLFGIGSRFAAPLTVLFSAVNTAWNPVYFSQRKKNQPNVGRYLGETVTLLTLVVSIASVGLFVLGPDLVRIMTPVEFHQSVSVLRILILASFLRGAYFVIVATLFYAKRTGLVALATVIGAAINLSGNIFLVPQLGAAGSAWAQVISNSVVLLVIVHFSRRIFLPVFEWKRLVPIMAFGFIVGLVSTIIPVEGLWEPIMIHIALVLAYFGLLWKELGNFIATCFYPEASSLPKGDSLRVDL